MANSDKNILIVPNTNQSGLPNIQFVGSSSAPISLSVLDDNTISFSGSQGQLFSINNNLISGTIFSVNDVSGIPSIEVDASGTITLARFGGNIAVSKLTPNAKLDVNGNTIITGTLNVTSNSTLAAVSGTTAQFTTLSGSTITGSTALFASDIFVSGSRIGRGPGTGATSNIVFGSSALNFNTTGFSNVAIGPSALSVNSIGFRNIAIGDRALENNTGGDDNIAIGATAAQATTGDRNTIVGSLAFQFNTGGSDNTGLGNRVLQQNTTGVGNTAIGRAALISNTTGSNNTAIGNAAGENLNNGSFNLFLGASAGQGETSLSNTVIISANTERMRIDSNGNVGIATSSPNSKLDVNGSTIISGNLTVTGSVFVSGSSIYGQVAELTSSTSNYTLLTQDSGKFLHMSSSSAMNLTVPSGLPVGFTVSFCQNGSGQITVVASGVTIKNRQSHTKTAGDGAVASLICTGSNGFILTGDTAA